MHREGTKHAKIVYLSFLLCVLRVFTVRNIGACVDVRRKMRIIGQTGVYSAGVLLRLRQRYQVAIER